MAKNPRILIGKDGSGEYVGKVSREGVNVFSAGPLETLFDFSVPVIAVAESGELTVSPGATGTYMFAEDFGYVPFALIACTTGWWTQSTNVGVYARSAGFAAIFPGPTFTQRAGFVTNVQSDRLSIRNIFGDVSQTFGFTIFRNRQPE